MNSFRYRPAGGYFSVFPFAGFEELSMGMSGTVLIAGHDEVQARSLTIYHNVVVSQSDIY